MIRRPRSWAPRWAWMALGAVVVGVLAIVAWPSGDTTERERAGALAAELKCQECQGLSVADSNAPTSRAIRADIRRRIDAGGSDAEIRQAYVDRYGEAILLRPRGSGLGLVMWVAPAVVLVGGASGIAVALARNRRESRLHATEADERLVEREREVRT